MILKNNYYLDMKEIRKENLASANDYSIIKMRFNAKRY